MMADFDWTHAYKSLKKILQTQNNIDRNQRDKQ